MSHFRFFVLLTMTADCETDGYLSSSGHPDPSDSRPPVVVNQPSTASQPASVTPHMEAPPIEAPPTEAPITPAPTIPALRFPSVGSLRALER